MSKHDASKELAVRQPADEVTRQKTRSEWKTFLRPNIEKALHTLHSNPEAMAQPLLLQTFEGKILDVNDQVVIVEFTMGERRELRKFSRAQFLVPEVRIQDVVQLRCKLVLFPPTPPLSEAAVEQWERDHADLEAAQAKTKRPKSLLEDE